jgi:non-heme chloroperoxidase
MPYITTADATQLYFKDWGKGRPVILAHGWPLSADSWDDQAMAIAEAGYRAIAYDRRGFGRSSQPWEGYDYDTLADDLAAVIEQTGAKDAVIIGFSMGGGEIARYLSRHSAKDVKQAALVSSIVPFRLRTDSELSGAAKDALVELVGAIKQDRARFFAGFFKDFFGVESMTNPCSMEVVEWARSIAMQASLRATLECARAFSTTDFREDMPAFTLPTLVIHGTADKTVPITAVGRAAVQKMTQAVLIEYDSAPHGLFATEKDRLTDDLLAFIRR